MFAQVQVLGVVADPPVRRQTQGGHAVTTVRLRVESADGGRARTGWWSVACWGALAHEAADLEVGDLVAAAGGLRSTKWIDRSGQERWGVEIGATTIARVGAGAGASPGPREDGGADHAMEDDGDIPF